MSRQNVKAPGSSERRMVVALDIDDTISRHPRLFSFLTRALLAAGHQVVIITFREDRVAAEQTLREWGIEWSKLITSTLEACLEVGVDEWKASECRKAGVDVFFEDDAGVLKHVDAGTFCVQPYVRGEVPGAATGNGPGVAASG